MEDNSEDVRIGRILHELKVDKKAELSVEGIKVDKITKEYVVEIKKSDADINAAMDQLKYYLMVLASKGIMRDGRLECIEKNKQDRKIHYISLDESEKEILVSTYQAIEAFLETKVPPDAIFASECKRCSYFEYCFI